MHGDRSRKHTAPPMTILPPASSTWGPSRAIWSTSPLNEMSDPGDRGADMSFAAPIPSLAGPSTRSASFATPMSPSQRLSFQPHQIPLHPSDAVSSLFEYEAPAPPAPVRVLIRRLPATTSEADMRLMLVFSQELVSVELMGPDNAEGAYYRSALLLFRSMKGATEARTMLDGRANMDGRTKMIVSILSSPDYGSPVSAPFAMPNGAPNANPDLFTAPVYRPQPAPVGNGFPPRDAMSPTSKGGRFFPAVPPHQDLAAPDTKAGSHYKNLFNFQSAIGNHLASEVPGRLGKHLINDELGDDDDDDRELLRDSFAYAGKATPAQRRGATPQDPINQALASMSLSSDTSSTPSPMPPSYLAGLPPVNGNTNYLSLGQLLQHQLQQRQQQQQQQQQQQCQPLPQLLQQNSQQQSVPQHNKQQQRAQPQQDKQEKQQQPPYGKANFPPVNPADQNPPCNTLYVGNLPADTSEEELKALFSPVRGYKRLCFRTKQNGPMCFVEFEDVGHATKALSQLYGWCLHNSVKGGIRLSFSKNPLGVRSPPSQPPHGNMPPLNGVPPSPANSFTSNGFTATGFTANGFTAASGPPPGLPKPPNFGNRAYTSYTPNSRPGSNMGTPINGSGAGSSFQRTTFYKAGMNMAKPHTPFA